MPTAPHWADSLRPGSPKAGQNLPGNSDLQNALHMLLSIGKFMYVFIHVLLILISKLIIHLSTSSPDPQSLKVMSYE